MPSNPGEIKFNIFQETSKDNIRVGYISTDRGFINNLSICDANRHAQKNPGTTFILNNRDGVKYLNINEVNQLTVDDLTPQDSSAQGTCESITGLSEKDAQSGTSPKNYETRVEFYGGGGVGVKGNPVIGDDGAVLAIDLESGGFGYQYPPIVRVIDDEDIGAGAVLRSVLCEIDETTQFFDSESDFEEYIICDDDDVGFGRRYDPNGNDIGPWNPDTYINLSKDPIRKEIEDYQQFLSQLTDPWWDTRKFAPLSVTSSQGTKRSKFDVTDEEHVAIVRENENWPDYTAWSDFMNSYAISPEPPSNVKGSDFGAIFYSFEWEEDFPYDGEYVFRGAGDGEIRELYLDNVKLGTLTSFADAPLVVKKTIESGVHRIRLDLKNGHIYEKVVETSTTSTQTSDLQTKKVFNTVDYINNADRSLFRTFPTVGKSGDFIHQYGVTPFDPNSAEASTDSFEGTHSINWSNINFPVDGNYVIEVAVDDEVDITFTKGSERIDISKKGFSSPGRSTGTSSYTKFFTAGNYNLNAQLKQISGKPLAGGNPMALAINVNVSYTENEIVAPRSWNENPMGIALTIDAPLPPIPVEPIPQQEGRCPNNPIWTTRFPSAGTSWWPVVDTLNRWSDFMDRYAISPVPPLGQEGTDSGGVVYKNTWNVELPYDGFYGLKGTVDNAGRILIDGIPQIQANYIPTYLENSKGGSGVEQRSGIEDIEGGTLFNWRENDPEVKKIFLTKGMHTIEVEVENGITETVTTIDQKIFNTADWISPPPTITEESKEEWVASNDAFVPPVSGTGRSSGTVTIPDDASFHRYDEGTYYLGKQVRSGGDWNDTDPYTNYIEWDSNTRLTLGSYHPGSGDRFGIKVWTRTVTTETTVVQNVGGTSRDGVTYEGPVITSYASGTLGPFITPSFVDPSEIMGKTWTMVWKNVDFPVTGQYQLEAEADDVLKIRVDGAEVGEARVFEGVATYNFTATAGKKTVELELTNVFIRPDDTFSTNPTVAAAKITTKVEVESGISKSWEENPMGISAILIPPPCPKTIRGQGVVCEVIVDDPGNGFKRPLGDGYPVALRLKSIEVENPGINYNCGVDQIQITPSNGASLSYECSSFGRITKVNVDDPGLGFTRYPDIRMVSDTGVNASFRPQFEVVRDPIVVDEDKLIQVVDLVGLQQTGYVDGRPYYGAVFYKDGIRYAGFYETPGTLVQVYDTLQESIDGEVTTRPSAILRQGTNVQSNNPRLNIPGTPENLI